MLEYILFKCRKSIDSKTYKYLSVLKKEGRHMYYYHVIDNHIQFKKRITKNTIKYLTEMSLISSRGCCSSNDLFLDFDQDCYFYDIVYRYDIM